jgi:hypothetical protein
MAAGDEQEQKRRARTKSLKWLRLGEEEGEYITRNLLSRFVVQTQTTGGLLFLVGATNRD